MSTDYQRLPQITSQQPVLKGDSRNVRWWVWRLSVTLGVAIVVLASFVVGRLMTLQETNDRPLRLNVRVAGSKIELTWNAQNPDVQNAGRGSLVILYSAEGDRVELNPMQLKAGRYEYAPLHADLTFLMTVYRSDDSFIEETKNVHLERTPDTDHWDVWSSESALARDNTESNTRVSTAPSPKLAAPTAPTHRVPPTLRIETPPEIGASTGLPQTRIPVSPAIPIAPAIPAYPLKPSRRPVVAPNGRSSFTVPVPVRRVSPDIPVTDRSLIHGNASVRVTVSVDAYGTVTDAKPLDIHSSDEKLLSRHVVEAAKLWRFEPARRRNGAPVASETVVVFHFIGR